MRRNFAQVLKSGNINIYQEYTRLYSMFYGKGGDGRSVRDMINSNFCDYYFRGTCLDLDDFDKQYGFSFLSSPPDFDTDYLVSFCEYVYNLIIPLNDWLFFDDCNKAFFFNQINKVMEAIGYMQAQEDDFVIFAPKDNCAIAVSESEVIPEYISYKVIAYSHHSMTGDLARKRQTLLSLSDLLEPRRQVLKEADGKLENDLFYLFNNLNIRHNNMDSAGKKYKEYVANMGQEELEHWYDEAFQMCLLAFMLLDHNVRKNEINALKSQIEEKRMER